MKSIVDAYLAKMTWLPSHLSDKILQGLSRLWPQHLPRRLIAFRDRYEHYLIVKANDDAIDTMAHILQRHFDASNDGDYLTCTEDEGQKALLQRFVAAGSAARQNIILGQQSGGILALDIALRRNDHDWHRALPPELDELILSRNICGHFFCHVLHLDFIVKANVPINDTKERILNFFDQHGAKYPAEHNVGHLYEAETELRDFYRGIDPSNRFNAGIGKDSKHQHYQ